MINLTPNVRRLIHGVCVHFQSSLSNSSGSILFGPKVSVEPRSAFNPDLRAPLLVMTAPRHTTVFRRASPSGRDVLSVHLNRADAQVAAPIIKPVAVDMINDGFVGRRESEQSTMQKDDRRLAASSVSDRVTVPLQTPPPPTYKIGIFAVDQNVSDDDAVTIYHRDTRRIFVNRFNGAGFLQRCPKAQQGAVAARASIDLGLLDDKSLTAPETCSVNVSAFAIRGTLLGHRIQPPVSSPGRDSGAGAYCVNYTIRLREGAA